MTLHVAMPRLLPFTIATLATVLLLKTIDLAQVAFTATRGPVTPSMVTEAHAAPADAPKAAAAPSPGVTTLSATTPVTTTSGATTPGATTPGATTPGAASPAPVTQVIEPPAISDSERSVLLELRQRRQDLDARDTTLRARESVLAAAELRLTARVQELTALQKKLETLEAARQQREEAGWQGLVKVYEDMKPRDAATIFNELQMPVLLAVVDRMKEAKAASVLAAMNPDKAREITTALAKLRTEREVPRGAAQNGGDGNGGKS